MAVRRLRFLCTGGSNMKRLSPEERERFFVSQYSLAFADGYGEIESATESPVASQAPFCFPVSEVCTIPMTEGKAVVRSVPISSKAAERISIVLAVEFSSGSAMPQPTGRYRITVQQQFQAEICTKHEHCQWQSKDMNVFFACEYSGFPDYNDYILQRFGAVSNGFLFITIPAEAVPDGEPVRIQIEGKGMDTARRMRLLKARGIPKYVKLEEYADQITGKSLNARINGVPVFWGDIHNHSAEQKDQADGGCGTGSAEENYQYARDVSRLDFYALAEHDYQIKDIEGWRKWESICAACHQDDSFVCLPSYEWTSGPYGHRNVYYAQEGGGFLTSRIDGEIWRSDNPGPQDLWTVLRESPVPGFTVPHHPSASEWPFDWDSFNPEFDRAVEIYSSWGSSELDESPFSGLGTQRLRGWGVREMLTRGLQFGLLASSDGHDGHAGNSQSPQYKHQHIYNLLGSGRVGVVCESLTRGNVWNAIYNRRCFATTGQSMSCDFTLNGTVMGQTLAAPSDGCAEMNVWLNGSAPLAEYDVILNGCLYSRYFLDACEHRDTIKLTIPSSADSVLYVRARQSDNSLLWSSPVFISTE